MSKKRLMKRRRPKKYKPRTGIASILAEEVKRLQVSNQQMGLTILALFDERDRALAENAALRQIWSKLNEAFEATRAGFAAAREKETGK
jgi:hypothetical protein